MPSFVAGALNLNKSPVAVLGPLFNTVFRPQLQEKWRFLLCASIPRLTLGSKTATNYRQLDVSGQRAYWRLAVTDRDSELLGFTGT